MLNSIIIVSAYQFSQRLYEKLERIIDVNLIRIIIIKEAWLMAIDCWRLVIIDSFGGDVVITRRWRCEAVSAVCKVYKVYMVACVGIHYAKTHDRFSPVRLAWHIFSQICGKYLGRIEKSGNFATLSYGADWL